MRCALARLTPPLAAAILSSALTALLLTRQPAPEPPHSPGYHEWIHRQLALTEEQERRLEPSERRYDETRSRLTETIRLANRELAHAIAADRSNSPRVQAAVRRIHEAMGELQQATLQHIFEMKAVLEPEQYDRLIALTKEALETQASQK